jgi:hypothetical protein
MWVIPFFEMLIHIELEDYIIFVARVVEFF